MRKAIGIYGKMPWSFWMVAAHALQGQEGPWNSHSPREKVEGKSKRLSGNI